MPAYKFVDNTPHFLNALSRQQGEAKQEVEDELIDNIMWMMHYGYHDPHGPDGHTEIYDTGALERSLEVKNAGNIYGSGIGMRPGTYNWRIEVSANTEYASYVHQGTYKLKGRPFIIDGINRAKPNVQRIIKRHMEG